LQLGEKTAQRGQKYESALHTFFPAIASTSPKLQCLQIVQASEAMFRVGFTTRSATQTIQSTTFCWHSTALGSFFQKAS
jgi:hypothetical protein